MSNPKQIGAIGWIDLTVDDAEQIREFYEQVVGWKSDPVEMGGYNDYCMISDPSPPSNTTTVSGICHRLGTNASFPGGWLIYITVADLQASRIRCLELGGKVIVEVRNMGMDQFCVIQDPSGAIAALYQHGQ